MAVAIASPMPVGSRAPVANTPVRFSDVAHFVGLSLLRDPNLARPKVVKNIGVMSRLGTAESQPDEEQMQSSSSLPSLSVERVDKLRCQINWLKAEQRAEKEQLKKLEHSLSDAVLMEKRAHDRAEQQRTKRNEHREHVNGVERRIQQVSEQKHAEQMAAAARTPSRGSLYSRNATPPTLASTPSNALRSTRELTRPASSDKMQSALSGAFEQPGLRSSSPTGSKAGGSRAGTASGSRAVVIKEGAGTAVQKPPSAEMFDNEFELANYRREEVRKAMMEKAGNALSAFAAINLNGSGRICSQEFADGVERLGVPWKQLTGLRRDRQLFKLFDTDRDGVITLYELFPSERGAVKDTGGATTPEFWESWVKGNRKESFRLDQPKGRHAKWNTQILKEVDDTEDGLAILAQQDRMNKDAAFYRKWMQKTHRRMKGRGKSDARCREMIALHLPQGTGPKDRQDVATFSENEVKKCRDGYKEVVNETQRVVTKAVYDIRETRKELSNARHELWKVSMEPILKAQALEDMKKGLGFGLGLGGKEEKKEEEEKKEKGLSSDMKSFMKGGIGDELEHAQWEETKAHH